MLIYEKDNKLNINFDNEISENPDLQISKEDGKTEVLIDGQQGGGSGDQTQKRTLYVALYGAGEYPEHPAPPSDLPDPSSTEYSWTINNRFGIFNENKEPLTLEEIKNIDVYNTVFKANPVIPTESGHIVDITIYPVFKEYYYYVAEDDVGGWVVKCTISLYDNEGSLIQAGVVYEIQEKSNFD